MTPTLNDKQLRFAHEYLIDMNAAAAARRAGYAASTRGNQAAALMKNPLVREAIAMGMADMFSEIKVTARELMQERARAAFFRARRMLDENGKLLPLAQIDEETFSVLDIRHELRANGDVVMRIRQPDRQQALTALEKAHGHAMEVMEGSLVYEEETEEEIEAREIQEAIAEAMVRLAEREAAKLVEAACLPDSVSELGAGLEDASVRVEAEPVVEADSALVGEAAVLEVAPKEAVPPVEAEAAYDLRKDPYWMLGGIYRFADAPWPPKAGSAVPAMPELPASASSVHEVPTLQRASLLSAVRRSLGLEPARGQGDSRGAMAG